MKTDIISLVYKKSINYQHNTINGKDAIIIKKYIRNNTKTVLWGYRCLVVD